MTVKEIRRGEFIMGAVALSVSGIAIGDASEVGFSELQEEVNLVTPDSYAEYLTAGRTGGFAALKRLDDAFAKVLDEIPRVEVKDKPIVWFVYNMGVVVKTRESCFAIDLVHPRAELMAPFLDFAMITHNHDDHYTDKFYNSMNDAGKMVISNFKDNYGVKDRQKAGGYARGSKVFRIRDVEIRTSLVDHNSYLVDFTLAFEIIIGKYVIFHSGDCSNAAKIKPLEKEPDIWIVHPRCGMNVLDGARILRPRKTVVAHLNEMGHGRYRWTFADGLSEKERLDANGYASLVPLWGDQI